MKCPRVLIAAPGSGSGKTTVTMAILSALKFKGVHCASFKIGPDYIDPMFHKNILHLPCSNLDSFLLGEERCKHLLVKNSREFQVIEGVMGYYDGIGTSSDSSTYEMAKITESPVILVMSLKGMALSAAAIATGLQNFKQDSGIQGIIFNGITDMMYPYYKSIFETHTSLKVLGYLPKMEDCEIGSRHLGLITAEEVNEIEDIIKRLGEMALKTIDLDGILDMGKEAPSISSTLGETKELANVNLAIGKDLAFSFYYDDTLQYLEKLGVRLLPFSPLKNERIPEDAHGLYLGGGYPENYMEELSNNYIFLDSIRRAFQKKLPIIAECGGFMVLQEFFKGEREYPLAGIFPGSCEMTSRLQNFGYLSLSAKEDSLLLKAGENLHAHEFHYSKSEFPGDFFYGQKPKSKRGWATGYGSKHYYVGYPHLHLFGNPKAAKRFIMKMKEYKEELWQKP
ncbi:MAG: cobyrinate a,c-diamide synthase [Tissierellia bacterium]|nr:cobyrinate a,c-diamide synthase [Tissierellia bacterium]